MAKEFGNAQDLVAIEDIKDDTVILNGGAMRQIIMVSGTNFSLKSDLEQNVITQAYQNFLNGLDFPLQIIIHSRKVNIDKYLENISRFEKQATSPILQNQASEYKEFIKSFVAKNAIMEKTFLVVVPFTALSIPGSASVSRGMSLSFFKKKGSAEASEAEAKTKEEAEAKFRENLAQLKQRVTQVIDGLLTIGLEATVLNAEQLIQLFYNFYNPETIEREDFSVTQKQ